MDKLLRLVTLKLRYDPLNPAGNVPPPPPSAGPGPGLSKGTPRGAAGAAAGAAAATASPRGGVGSQQQQVPPWAKVEVKAEPPQAPERGADTAAARAAGAGGAGFGDLQGTGMDLDVGTQQQQHWQRHTPPPAAPGARGFAPGAFATPQHTPLGPGPMGIGGGAAAAPPPSPHHHQQPLAGPGPGSGMPPHASGAGLPPPGHQLGGGSGFRGRGGPITRASPCLWLSGLPPAVADGTLRAECAKAAAVEAVILAGCSTGAALGLGPGEAFVVFRTAVP